LRRLALGLATLAGRRWGFFIPSRHAAAADTARHAPYAATEALFAAGVPAFRALIAGAAPLAEALAAIGRDAPAPAPRWNQDWFPGLDAAVAYTVVRTRRPRLLIEVGCGHSTRFFARAAADEGYAIAQLAIDPAPRARLAGLGITWVDATLQGADPAPFARIGAGDIASLDGSHVLMPGTDADLFLNRVMPALAAGALVHLHDVFLPDDYPPAWAWRGYNEQQGIAALLQGRAWRVLWASHFVRTRRPDLLAGSALAALTVPAGAHESSLWLEKTAG
jgi:hypothetical protein